MAYDEMFWATTATVGAAIFVATTISLTQSLDAMVTRIEEQHRGLDQPGSRRWMRARRRALLASYVFAGASLLVALVALLLSLLALSGHTSVIPPGVCVTLLTVSATAEIVQLFKAADAKLAAANAASPAATRNDR